MSARQKRTKPLQAVAVLAVVAALAAGLIAYVLRYDVAVLQPAGSIAEAQYNLIVFTSLLSLIIVIPVFTLTFFIVWKYRASNKKAKYAPDWDGNKWLESAWWAIPLALISMLAVITWRSSHALDPYKPLESTKKPLTVQVVAMEWKWLFIYPEQNIATVNYLHIPEDTPINFEITADAPMNSFWIPKLGGQVYAMAGMQTKLHLEASDPGEFTGSSANLSGEGFADMRFTVRASTEAEFAQWVQNIKDHNEDRVGKIETALSQDGYNKLRQPGTVDAPRIFRLVDPALYDTIIMKYMMPGGHSDGHRPNREGNH